MGNGQSDIRYVPIHIQDARLYREGPAIYSPLSFALLVCEPKSDKCLYSSSLNVRKYPCDTILVDEETKLVNSVCCRNSPRTSRFGVKLHVDGVVC